MTRISAALWIALLTAFAWPGAGRADTAQATCEVRKDAATKFGARGPCKFSQRQGYVTLGLQDGEILSLSPGGQANHFQDQSGQRVTRTRASGNTHEYQWQGGRVVVVTFAGGGDGAGGGADRSIAVADMGRHCIGQASAKFGRNTRDLQVQSVTQDNGVYIVRGQFPGNTGPQAFVCRYSKERRLVGVEKSQP